MNNKNQPLVSVIMTAYNAGRFISEALESILNQTYKNLEIIVVDDGSTDETYQMVMRYARQDKRIQVYRLEKNVGPSLASNFAIPKARGEYIARMDADDVSTPERIEKQVAFLKSHPEVVLVGGQAVLIDDYRMKIGDKKYPLTHKEINNTLFTVNPILHPSCMINMKVVSKDKLVYQNHSVLAHDYELIFQLMQFGETANLPDTVIRYRQHRNSLSLHNPKETFWATCDIRRKAVSIYGFRPSLKSWLTHYLQILAVTILPSDLIYPVFLTLRTGRVHLRGKVRRVLAENKIIRNLAFRYTG